MIRIFIALDQARQTRQNLGGGGGLQRASQDSTNGGCDNFLHFTR